MDENGAASSGHCYPLQQETFQRVQEAQFQHRFPPNPSGIVPVPRGSRGPRSLYLRRYGDSFGFTLRHFIIYPPDSITEHYDGRHAAVGALLAPMDTIFVKRVHDRGAAKKAGLQKGDRLIAVNGIPVKGKTYAQVVQLIQNSPEYLHLLVVPKEEDVLQRFFADTAHNPISNQNICSDIPSDRVSAQRILSQHLSQFPPGVQVDAISWRSLQQPYYTHTPDFASLQRVSYNRGQRSADSLLCSEPRKQNSQQEIYAEIRPDEFSQRQRCKAVPQVPLYRKMGRRASEGSAPYEPAEDSSLSEDYNMKAIYKSNYLQEGADMPGLNAYPNTAGCRLSLDVGRRESTSSLSSSIADGSKDSLASFDSASTLTGHETDDSAIMTRFRKSVQQKEEFLKTPTNTVDQALIRREFYSRPKKLEKQVWPPNERESPKSPKPAHQNVLRVKSDMENERDMVAGQQINQSRGGADCLMPQQRGATSPKERTNADLERIYEAAPAPYDFEAINGTIVEESASTDDRRVRPPAPLQIVHRRARDFESGRPLPSDDPTQINRTDFSRSELARLGSKRLVPCVTERATEYEIRTVSTAAQPTITSPPPVVKRVPRDSRSLDGSDVSSIEGTKVRARSNSAESWVAALGNEKRLTRQDAALTDRSKAIVEDQPVVVKRRPKNTNIADDERAMRRESYLKATEGGRMHIDSDLSDSGEVPPQVLRGAHRRWRPPLFPGDIQQLRKLFEDAASSLGGSASSSSASLDRDKVSGSPSPLDKDKQGIVREGILHCKILEIDGKRATDRSWKQVFVVLKGPKLFLYKDRHHQSPVGVSTLDHHHPAPEPLHPMLAGGVDVRACAVRVADDYTKRKHVARVSAVEPCRAELLLRADAADEFADWVRTLQERAADSTEAELDPVGCKQQAVPQLIPATTTIQVQGSHLSPQLSKAKASSSRNRSPTGQSPVSKSRKPSQILDSASTSPKSKTWKGRVARQFRKFNQGGNSPSSPTAPEGSTFGVAIEDCIPSASNIYLPRFVEVCTEIIDEKGLQTLGIYRVPGNNASITALTEEINRNFDDVPLEDPRWNDLHVVSSLLKSYFRKMPDSLITVQLYPSFIKADKLENPKERLEELRRLVRNLPKHNYHTLKHIIMHLKKVADNSEVNKMEAKNLAIVFGPTIVRPEGENMESMVNDMTNQCKIVESLLTHADWFFPENDSDENLPVPLEPSNGAEEFESANNQVLLLHNISKYEALKDPKEKNGALFSSIISAAQRKVKRKPNKSNNSLHDSKEEPTTPTNLKVFPTQSFSPTDLKENCSNIEGKIHDDIPTTVIDIEKKTNIKPTEKVPWFNYSTDRDEFHRRIQNFKQETEAMLQLPRKTEISINNIDSRVIGQLSSSASNVSHNPRLSMKPGDLHLLTKTHSASNVFSRTVATSSSATAMTSSRQHDAGARNSLNSGVFLIQCRNEKSLKCDSERRSGNASKSEKHDAKDDKRMIRGNIRRGSSVENVSSSSADVSNMGNLKKIKYETESESQRSGSLDSLNKFANDDESLLSTMTKLIDEKLKGEHCQSTTKVADEIPYVDESPEKSSGKKSYSTDKENIPQASDLYRNPSLHKNQFGASKQSSCKKEEKEFMEKEKEEDTMAAENVPDNDRHIAIMNKMNQNAGGSKLRRSESLNKTERTVSPLNNKLKRSESLNKSGDKLKRSDSLSKNEKTESNINKRRELSLSNKRFKDNTIKNKRKNGMPDRSIKRRHTVGGTKDPDKVTWLMDNKNQEESTTVAESLKEKNLRTSSPDLSSSRRDRFFFEINLIGPDNMVVALRQHLIGSRPQSFPESTTVLVPLESHV